MAPDTEAETASPTSLNQNVSGERGAAARAQLPLPLLVGASALLAHPRLIKQLASHNAAWQYGSHEYWDHRYAREPVMFDWWVRRQVQQQCAPIFCARLPCSAAPVWCALVQRPMHCRAPSSEP